MQKTNYTINVKGRLVDLNQPKIMGILNCTPDSFSDGGKFNSLTNALIQAEKMVAEGASIIDIGAQSTRPNAKKISAAGEIKRLSTIISEIKKEFPETLVSLDTFYSEVVEFGVQQGIDIVNDISGGQFDPDLLPTVAKHKLPYVVMHINNSYQTMHDKDENTDITITENSYFSEKIQHLKSLGIWDVILDPGFGFGKTEQQNHQLIDDLRHIAFEKFPILVGISRKSFIYKPLKKTPTTIQKETLELHRKLLRNGAKIVRVHDVRDAKIAIETF